jgi:hypothetical protein
MTFSQPFAGLVAAACVKLETPTNETDRLPWFQAQNRVRLHHQEERPQAQLPLRMHRVVLLVR